MLRIAGRLSSAAFVSAVLAVAPGVAGAAHLTRAAHIVGAPTYELVSAYDGKCLDVYGGATGNGSRVDQWTCNGGSNQLWKVVHVGTTSGNLPIYTFMGVGSGRCLDVYGASHANGATIDIWDCNGQANQQWIDFPESGNDLIDRNTENDANPKVLEIYGGATGNGARVDQWAENTSTTKGWRFR